MSRQIHIFDTTLRDGEQSPGASMNIEEKLEVAHQLALLNVDVIEAGFAISSPDDFEAVKQIAQRVKGPTICSLARARKEDIERAWEALQYAEKPRIHTFIATSPIHMQYKLKKSPEEVLQIAVEMVRYACSLCPEVEFSAEDAGRSDKDFLYRIYEAVIDAGATVVNVPDTVGYTQPQEFGDLIRGIRENVPNIGKAVISVHCHNDLGLAVANSLAAVMNGASQVECTINGIGERAGNAALEEIVMAIRTRRDFFAMHTGINTREIHKASRIVSAVTGIHVQPNKAIVGANAFAHEAGIHQDGVLKEKSTYEIMDAESIGLKASELVLGKHSGRHAFSKRLEELGFELSREEIDKAFERFKRLADKKKEVTDRDLEAIVADEISSIAETYALRYVQATSGNTTRPSATVQLVKNDGNSEFLLEGAALGTGPVDAVYRTIDSLVEEPVQLVDYSIQSITGGTNAMGEVTVRIRDDGKTFMGRGSDTDIIVASARAYLAAINRMRSQRDKQKGAAARL